MGTVAVGLVAPGAADGLCGFSRKTEAAPVGAKCLETGRIGPCRYAIHNSLEQSRFINLFSTE
jgi:hypothetical protein